MRRCLLLAVVLLGLAGSAAAQDNPPRPSTISGVVLNQQGQLRPGVAVRLQPLNVAEPTLIERTNDKGIYTFTNVKTGEYDLDVLVARNPPTAQRLQVTDGSSQTKDIVVPSTAVDPRRNFILVAVSILLYCVALLAFRHNNIVHTNRQLLRAQLENIETRIPLESDPDREAQAQKLRERVGDIAKTVPIDPSWHEVFFWSRGREIGAWTRVHEVERQLVAFLVPEARVVERSVTAEADLRVMTDSPAAIALADRMRVTLEKIFSGTGVAADPVDPHMLDHLKQQLAEALTLLYDDGDTKFAGLMEWHNKAMWLVYVALLVIAAVGVVFHHEELFLLGAAGGLMSRMARSLHREDVPSDYGASWTTLFLSPLLGAISAWFGIAMMVWLREMGVLGDKVFGFIDWNGEVDALMIGMAFTLGFSERLFTSLLSAVEGEVDTALTKTPPTPAPVSRTLPATPSPGAAHTAPAQPEAPAGPSTASQIVAELDLQSGERAAFVGDAASKARAQMVAILGADNVFDVAPDTIGTRAPLDGVLFESPSTIDGLTAAASQLRNALRPNARVVIVGRTPAIQFDALADTQRAQNHVGPALAKAILTKGADIVAQEPPATLGGTDPVDWMAAFAKPEPGGTDR